MIYHEVDQGSPEWLQLRLGKVTSTRAKDVVGTGRKALMIQMIAEKYEKNKDFKSDDMLNGTLKESWALDDYEELTGENLETIGFVEKNEDVGFSPDAMCRKRTKSVQVKCPLLKTHLKYILAGNKIPAEYRWAAVHEFATEPNLKEMDFVSYNQKWHKKLHIITVTREDFAEDIQLYEEKLDSFLKDYKEVISKLM